MLQAVWISRSRSEVPCIGAGLALDRSRVSEQVMPHLQAYYTDLAEATRLAEQVVGSLPPSWVRGSLPQTAVPLRTFVADLQNRARSSRSVNAAAVQRLSALAEKLSGR